MLPIRRMNRMMWFSFRAISVVRRAYIVSLHIQHLLRARFAAVSREGQRKRTFAHRSLATPMLVLSVLAACKGATSEPFTGVLVSGSVRSATGTPAHNASVVVQTFPGACGIGGPIHSASGTTDSQGAYRVQLGSGFDGCIRVAATVPDGRSAFVVREGVLVAGGDTVTQMNVTLPN